MQLGLTWPLQRFLKTSVPYGESVDRCYCWDAHCITLHGRSSLLLVHCWSRFTCVYFDMSKYNWTDLTGIAKEEIKECLFEAGIPPEKVEQYLRQAGGVQLTRTHGRREVAFLNRAWENALALDLLVNRDEQRQPLLNHAINAQPCRCAGEEGIFSAQEHLQHYFSEIISCKQE